MRGGTKTFLAFRAAALAVLVLLCAVPLAWAGLRALEADPGASPGETLWGARQWGLLWGTLAMSGGAAALATILGGALGVALGYFRPRGARVALALASLPLFMPPYLLAMAWVDVFGMQAWLQPSSIPAAGPPLLSLRGHGASAFVLGLCYFPLVMLVVVAALRRYDFQGDAAARLHAGHARVLWSLVLPQVRAALALGAMAVFLLSLLNLAVPSLLQAPVYAVEVYTWFNTQVSPARALQQALPMFAAAFLIAIALWRGLQAEHTQLAAGSTSNEPLQRSARAHTLVLLAAVTGIALSIGLPLAALCVRAWPLHNFVEALGTVGDELATSCLLALTSAAGCVLLGLIVACSGDFLARAGTAVAALPLLVAGPVFAVGFIAFWNHAGLRGVLYDSPAALWCVCVGKYAGLAVCMLHLAARALPRQAAEAAAVHGAAPVQILLRITWPALAPVALGAALLSFILVFGEVDAVLLTAPPGITPVSVRLFSLLHYGPNSITAALTLICAGLLLPPAFGAIWLLTREPRA